MGVLLNGTNQNLFNPASPVTGSGYPFTCAAWVFPALAATNMAIFALANSATATNLLCIRKSGADVFQITANDGATTNGTSTGTLAVNTWGFVIGRFISATNRRMSILFPNGSIEHVQNTTSRTPTGLNRVDIGALGNSTVAQFWNGVIGEVWWTNTDIQPDGGQLSDNLVRQLAFGGPWSAPHVMEDLIEYHSLRRSLPTAAHYLDSYFSKFGKQNWTNNNNGRMGIHPSLPFEFDQGPLYIPRPVII